MTRGLLLLVALASALPACDWLQDSVDLERMLNQPYYRPYEECDVCPDGTIMMQPPAGTIARSAPLLPRAIAEGRLATGEYVQALPLPMDLRALARGKNRFDIFCAACHGRLGDGNSQVAENMLLRKPPNLLAPPYAAYPPGRVFAAITEGFGLMRSYAAELTVPDRWAVVGYMQALALAQEVPLAALPPQLQEEARRWLK